MIANKRAVVIGDTHFPWVNEDTLARIFQIIKDVKPHYVIQVGDLYDLYSHTKFARTHNICTPQQEVVDGRQMAEEMWKHVKKIAPKAKLYQLLGNHDKRPLMRVAEKYPEVEAWVSLNHLYEFNKVQTIHDYSDELELDFGGEVGKILFHHGYRSKLGDHAKYNLQSTVVGHTHTGGVVYFNLRAPGGDTKTVFEMNAGFCADTKAVPLRYTATKYTKWTQGCGVIDEKGPRFIPL